MKLEILHPDHYPYKCQQIVYCYGFKLVKIGRKWYALDSRSADPLKLASKSTVDAWARAQGLMPKDVHNYIRRERKRINDEYKQSSLREKLLYAHAAGYTIVCPNGQPWLPTTHGEKL